MTKKEAKAMEGTEFIYEFEDGDTMSAYVKKVDVKTGQMSCWSFSLTTDQGYEFEPQNKDEEAEGACCVLVGRDWDETKRELTEVATGRLASVGGAGLFNGCVF